MRVLIFGGKGFIAQFLASNLSDRGWEVCGIGTRHLGPLAIERNRDERSMYLELMSCLRNLSPDVVIHMSSFCLRSPTDESLSLAKSRDINLINAIQSNVDCCRLIFLGSMACFPTNGRALTPNNRAPVSHYGVEKAFMSDLIGQSPSLHSTIIYPSSIFGPGQGGNMLIPSLFASIANKSVLKASGSEKVRDYIFVEDFCDFLAELIVDDTLEKKEELFVQSGCKLSLSEVAEVVAKACNLEVDSFVSFKDSPTDADDYQTTAGKYTRFIKDPTEFTKGISRCAHQIE